jgi:GAF domain-containing protein
MGRGSSRAKGNAKPAAPHKSQKHQDDARVRELEKRLAESLERERAAGEILRVISSSPASVQPTFEAIASAAMSLCEADIGSLFRFDGQLIHVGAFHGTPAEVEDSRRAFPQRPGHGSVTARAIFAATVVQIDDVSKDPEAADALRAFRTVLSVPMIRDGRSLGAITVARRVVRPFSDEQIELVKTFADQAIIAIENVRLFKELEARNHDLSEALDQQTATSEILRVISSSPTDIQPVFDAIARNAVALCGGIRALVLRFDGTMLHIAGHHNIDPGGVEQIWRAFPRHASRDYPPDQALLDRSVVHVPDLQAATEFGASTARQRGVGSMLAVPLLREQEAVGVISLARDVAGSFSPQQIAVLQTFADQAVIAIENVRLFTELQDKNRALTESLDQQTATGEILRVIASSPTDIEPVFAAVVSSAARLCDALDATIFQIDGDRLRVAVHTGPIASHPLGEGPSLAWETPSGRAVLDRRTIHVEDTQAEIDEYPEGSEHARGWGFRTVLAVPLMREGAAIGVINLRRTEARLFTRRQVALLETFAAQAVIAIENVRLFKELQARNQDLATALDRQTTTADVLRIIAQSPTELQPVLDAIATSAMRLCEASDGVIERLEGDRFYNAAHAGTQMKGLVGLPLPLTRRFPGGRAILDRTPIIIDDIHLVAESEYPDTLELLKLNTIHSVAEIPLLSEGKPLGSIAVLRAEIRPFTAAEVTLLQTFADQAVIAIENVRLFTELQEKNRALTQAHAHVTEALDQQTATSEILRVIGRSPTDAQPVFDTIAQSAVSVCAAFACAVFVVDGDMLRVAATHGVPPKRLERFRQEYPVPLDSEIDSAQTTRMRRVFHLADIEHNPNASAGDVENARLGGYQTRLMVPMVRGDRALGLIAVTREAPTPFSDQQVELLQTFADQAVIAIENVRLFKELEEKNRALTAAHAEVMETLEQQTATADVLKVISRSTFDLQPVLNTLIESATRLCGADKGFIFRREGDVYRGVADHGTTPEHRDYIHRTPVAVGRGTVVGRVALERRTIHFPDILLDPEYQWAEAQRIARFRTVLGVPMLREGEPIGVFFIWSEEVRPFTDKQIELVTTFADQAVIAIENTRLLRELQARTADLTRSVEQLTALGEVGRAVSSTLDLETVLKTIVSHAVQLSGLDGGVVFEYDESVEEFVQRAMTETSEALAEARRATRIRKDEGVLGRTATTLEPVQVADIAMPGAYEGRLREVLINSGIRAILAVPMVRESHLIGCLGVTRNSPGAFPAATIELLRTFATQSALAIQNARLFREIEQKSRDLEAASRHKSEFLANMSHELRTPLNAIIGFSEVLSERMFGELNEKQDEYLKDIHASGQHLLSLINDILDLSKIEAGRMELELSDFDLAITIDNALTLVRERAGRRSISLHTTVDERLGQIQADERKIRQVLLNLLSNAIKFTPEGGRIDVEAKPVNGSIEMSVSDTGVGIAPEDQEAVFEEFRQVGTADKKVEGTGLGLALSRKFIELHGGKIWVKSQVGQGSTFTFTVPVRRGE